MTARSAFAKSLYAVATLALMAAAPACSSADAAAGAESSQNAISTTTVKHGVTKSFTGSFSVDIDRSRIKVVFGITDINWGASTARWTARILDADGHPTAVDDVDVPMSITFPQRCAGCYEFNAKESDGSALAHVVFSNFELGQLAWSGIVARDATITGASEGGEAGASTDEVKGTCSLVCGGSASQCQSGVTKADCNASLFPSRPSSPRCPQTFEFAAGATCGR